MESISVGFLFFFKLKIIFKKEKLFLQLLRKVCVWTANIKFELL